MSIISQPDFPRTDLSPFNALTLPEFIDIPAINGMAREDQPYQMPLFGVAMRALDLLRPGEPDDLSHFTAFREGIETLNVMTLAVTDGTVDLKPIELEKWSEYVASDYSAHYRIAERAATWAEEFRNTKEAVARIGERYPLAIQNLSMRALAVQMAEEIQRGDYY